MDIVKVQKDLEAYLCSNNRVRLVLINTNTSRYQMIDCYEDNFLSEGNFRDYVITLAERIPKNVKENFVINMSLKNVKSKITDSSDAYSFSYKMEEPFKSDRYEMVTFWNYKEDLIGAVFSDITKQMKEQKKLHFQCNNFKKKMEFLAKSLTLFFCEIDLETHVCDMWSKKSWFKDFISYEEQVTWILNNFILPEERAMYQEQLALENIIKKTRNGSYEFICKGSYQFCNYILKIVFSTVKEENTGNEKLYIYAEDISKLKEQEDKNQQLLEISKQLLDISQNDGLTGLYNRAAAEKEIKDYFQEEVEESIGALILIDVDHFKFFNDEYGHIVGDKVLKHVALSLRNAFRSKDILCRWGGDEFMILMKGCTGEKVIQSRIERLRMFMGTFSEQEMNLKVSLSIGAAVAHKKESFDELFERTDELLYQVKRNGRDRFLIDAEDKIDV